MLFFDFIRLADPRVTPESAKVHLATPSADDAPLQAYFEGRFKEFQDQQSRRNFERPYVVSLIGLREPRQWLYVGVYTSSPYSERPDHPLPYLYDLQSLETCAEFAGRLVLHHPRVGQVAYLNGATVHPTLQLHELRAEKLHFAEFPGYKRIDISFADLRIIVGQSIATWRTALTNAAGVYLITDTMTGQLYVGSATGAGGFWARWSEYAAGGHGQNVALKALVGPAIERAEHFRYTVLEIADQGTSIPDILEREAHWKRVLGSREFGHNRN